MRRTIRETLVSARDLIFTAGPFILLALVLVAGTYFIMKPTPPKRVVMATGSAQGAYAAFGKRYAEELKRHGVQVELRGTAGSRENQRLLRDEKSDVDIAFVQGGSGEVIRTPQQEDEDLALMSLGSMFFEPVWIFYRAQSAVGSSPDGVFREFTQFRGLKVNAGPRGSGIPGIVNRLLAANLMERTDIQRTELDLTPAVAAMLGGEIDAVVLVSAPESQLVQMLLQTPGIRLFEFTQAEAYSRRFRFLSPMTLSRGVVDLSRNVPAEDVHLVAATSSLVAREDMHPALVQLFVQAATRIHGGGSWTSRAGQFPSALNSEFPLARDAERYYRNGPPLLQRYLPFWLANFVERMWVALLSLAVVLVPLSRILPPIYTFRIRSRVFRWYRVLRQIEDELQRGDTPAEELLARVEKLDGKVGRVSVPLSYTHELYELRGAIHMVRKRLRGAPAEAAGAAPATSAE